VNFICPSQLPNAETTSTRNPGDTLTCSGGSIPVPGAYELKLRTFPAPTPGMGGELYLRENGTFQGPFAIAGP
jgi:hypothetical protein